jgi:hypothetical protein
LVQPPMRQKRPYFKRVLSTGMVRLS